MMIKQGLDASPLPFEEFSNYREVDFSVSSCDNNKETKISSVWDIVIVEKGLVLEKRPREIY